MSKLLSLLTAFWAWLTNSEPETTPAPSAPVEDPEPEIQSISPGVLQFLLSGHPAEEQADLKRQIAAHEAAGETRYTLRYEGGYYRIDRGQIVGSGRD